MSTGRPAARSYREVETATILTSPILRRPAEAALALLSASRDAHEDPHTPGGSIFTWQGVSGAGTRIALELRGPDVPSTVPPEVIRPGDIGKDPKWHGTYRLIVRAPIVALDFAWRPDESMRIMTFANGDWSSELMHLAEP
jgi:hypothetical protein